MSKPASRGGAESDFGTRGQTFAAPGADDGAGKGDTPHFARMKRAIRKAERLAGDGTERGGTGATILKFVSAPLARLADKQRIGAEEMRAADDIATAFYAQAGALMIRPPA